MNYELVGRGPEMAVLARFLDGIAAGPGAFVLRGEAGVGKTTIWRSACDAAAERGIRVLTTRPTEAEARLSFSAATDLVGRSLADLASELPEPQYRALRVATRQADTGGRRVDRHAVAAGFRSLLEALAREQPLLVAVDDAQWLDESSARLLAFAVRRLAAGDRIGVLLGVRSGEDGLPFVLGARDALPSEAYFEVDVSAFGLDDLHHVLLAHLGHVPPRPLLSRIAEASGGNPLYALAIARHVAAEPGTGEPGAALPLPRSVSAALAGPVEALPARTRQALLLVALSSTPTLGPLGRATNGRAEKALARAEKARVIEIVGTDVRFAHPLLAGVSRSLASASELRIAHRALARASTDPEEQARHLALGTREPDERIAQALEDAATIAQQRGATDAAAELAALAAERTPPALSMEGERRALLCGECLILAGDTPEALVVLGRLADSAEDTAIRARAMLRAARLAFLSGNSFGAAELGERALAAVDEPTLRAAVQVELAFLYTKHDFARGLEHAEAALDFLETTTPIDERLLARVLVAMIDLKLNLGYPLDADRMARALALPSDVSEPSVSDRLPYHLGNILLGYDEISPARALLEGARADALDEGDEGSLPIVLDQLAQIEVAAGNWTLARSYADRLIELASRADQPNLRLAGIEMLASIDAREGRNTPALERAMMALEGLLRGDPAELSYGYRTLGFTHLAAGDARAAADAFSAVDRLCEQLGVFAPGILGHQGDHVEAVLELGDLALAESLLERLERQASDSRVGSALAVAARSRALLLGARGDLVAASREAARAIELGRPLEMPFELGRSILVQGQLLRRRRQKRLAKEALDQAEAIFVELGSQPWIDRTRAESRRLGLRTISQQELTTTEARVAELAAAGLTNPEIAAQLFMSRKTVEFNLGKVYRKLGIRGRTELAAHAHKLHGGRSNVSSV